MPRYQTLMTNAHDAGPSNDTSSTTDALTDQELDQVNGGAVHQAVAVGHRDRPRAQHDTCSYICGGKSMDAPAYASSGAATKG